MNLTSLAQAKDEVFGPVGTPERDRYEEELAKEIEKAIKKGVANSERISLTWPPVNGRSNWDDRLHVPSPAFRRLVAAALTDNEFPYLYDSYIPEIIESSGYQSNDGHDGHHHPPVEG